MDSLNRFRIYLTRLEVFPGWDAWTLIPVALVLLALIAAFACYAYSVYSRSRHLDGIDWDVELGLNRNWISRVDLRNPLHRLLMMGFCVLTFSIGAHAIWTRHFSSYDVGRYSHHGRHYSTDGAPAVAAGALLCVIGVMLGVVVVFNDSELLNRHWGQRKPLDQDTGEDGF